jgi:peptide/nickel transport system permease protein
MSTTATDQQTAAGAGAGATIHAELPPSARGDIWRRFRRNRGALVGLCVVSVAVLAAIFAPLITFYDPAQINPAISRQGPSLQHWFGVDLLGRDLYTRVVYGARVSLRVGVFATAIAVSIGLVVGAVSGYYQGWIETLTMRSTDVFLAFPYLLFAITIIVIIGRGELTVILVLGRLGWMTIARLFRSSILSVKQTEYVEAARAVGCSDLRIIGRHILPNVIQPVIVYATLFIGGAILAEAALSFLNVGIAEPTPSWGLMVAQGRSFLFTSPHMLFAPGLALFLVVLSFVFMGDGLRDALDPRLR